MSNCAKVIILGPLCFAMGCTESNVEGFVPCPEASRIALASDEDMASGATVEEALAGLEYQTGHDVVLDFGFTDTYLWSTTQSGPAELVDFESGARAGCPVGLHAEVPVEVSLQTTSGMTARVDTVVRIPYADDAPVVHFSVDVDLASLPGTPYQPIVEAESCVPSGELDALVIRVDRSGSGEVPFLEGGFTGWYSSPDLKCSGSLGSWSRSL